MTELLFAFRDFQAEVTPVPSDQFFLDLEGPAGSCEIVVMRQKPIIPEMTENTIFTRFRPMLEQLIAMPAMPGILGKIVQIQQNSIAIQQIIGLLVYDIDRVIQFIQHGRIHIEIQRGGTPLVLDIHRIGILAKALGMVQGHVGLSVEIIEILLGVFQKDDTHRGRQRDTMQRPPDDRMVQEIAELLGQSVDITLIRSVFQQDGELITPQPAGENILPKYSEDGRTDQTQYLVSLHMAETVIDLLEVVYIHHQQCGRPVIDRSVVFKNRIHPPLERLTVQQACKTIQL